MHCGTLSLCWAKPTAPSKHSLRPDPHNPCTSGGMTTHEMQHMQSSRMLLLLGRLLPPPPHCSRRTSQPQRAGVQPDATPPTSLPGTKADGRSGCSGHRQQCRPNRKIHGSSSRARSWPVAVCVPHKPGTAPAGRPACLPSKPPGAAPYAWAAHRATHGSPRPPHPCHHLPPSSPAGIPKPLPHMPLHSSHTPLTLSPCSTHTTCLPLACTLATHAAHACPPTTSRPCHAADRVPLLKLLLLTPSPYYPPTHTPLACLPRTRALLHLLPASRATPPMPPLTPGPLRSSPGYASLHSSRCHFMPP